MLPITNNNLPSVLNTEKKQLKNKFKVSPFEATDDEIGKTCSICVSGIVNGETVVLCPECRMPYHYDCWEEMGGCGSYGCAAAPEIKKADYGPAYVYADAWMSEKKCPECGSMIPSNALVCPICRSEFPTDKPMTELEWRNRTYDVNELLLVRLGVIGQFVVSLFIFFSAFTFITNLYTIFLSDKLWWIYKIKRLPSELKVLHYAGTIISGLNLLGLLIVYISTLGIK